MAFVKKEPKVKKLLCDDMIDFKRKESHSIFLDFLNTSKEKRFEVSSEDGSITSQKLYITKIIQAKFVKEKPNKMIFRYDFDGEPVNEFDLFKLTRHRSIAPLYSVELLPKLYSEEPGISKKKFFLLKLCQQNLIPPQYHSFYEQLKESE